MSQFQLLDAECFSEISVYGVKNFIFFKMVSAILHSYVVSLVTTLDAINANHRPSWIAENVEELKLIQIV